MIRTVMSSGQANKASSVILRKDDNSSVDTLEGMLVSCSSSVLQGSRSRVGLEEVVLGKVQKRQLYASAETSEEFREDDIMVDESFVHQPEKKRRLNADQVKFLERSFEAENKLEPDRKLQLAKDLSLQPRQVAVWFQNRRARWKTKQLEKDYEALKANFDKLRVDYDALLKEKNQLRDKVEGLTSKMKEEIKQEQRDSLICGVSVDPEDTKEPPEKIDRCETPVGTRNSHARIKVIPEHTTEVKKEGSTSSGSDESAVVDINSPYTIESCISTVEAGVSYSAVPFLNADDPPDLAILAGIPSKVLPPQAFQQFTKTESGLFEDQNCFFPVDEQGTFSWWSWP